MESIQFMVARWLQINVENSSFISQFKQLGFNLKDKRDTQEGLNEMDDKEQQSVKLFGYFINILDNLNQDNINTIKKHYEQLISSLLILQPPVRTSCYIFAQITTML